MHTKNKGNIGENIACTYINSKGYKVILRNFARPWGEIDIIATKDDILQFFEVKSVTVDFGTLSNVHKPEENVNSWKLRQIRRMVETYFGNVHLPLDTKFNFHIVCVYLDMQKRRARVKLLENVVL